jgi:hypothetical protein
MTACVCFMLVCVCVLLFVKGTICGINENYLKEAAPLKAAKCSTACSMKLPFYGWKLSYLPIEFSVGMLLV